MKSKRSTEVAARLMDIFPLLGAPAILQSDNGTEFTSHVISEIKDFWPALVMVHGKARHPQSQGSVARVKGDIKDMLVVWLAASSRSLLHVWLADNDSHDWLTGIKCVQFQKTSAHHSGIKRSPCSALSGEEVRVGHGSNLVFYGLSTITVISGRLPQEVLSKLDNEKDLLAVIMDPPSTSVNISSNALFCQ